MNNTKKSITDTTINDTKDIIERFKKFDFDPQEKNQRQIFNKITAPAPAAKKRPGYMKFVFATAVSFAALLIVINSRSYKNEIAVESDISAKSAVVSQPMQDNRNQVADALFVAQESAEVHPQDIKKTVAAVPQQSVKDAMQVREIAASEASNIADNVSRKEAMYRSSKPVQPSKKIDDALKQIAYGEAAVQSSKTEDAKASLAVNAAEVKRKSITKDRDSKAFKLDVSADKGAIAMEPANKITQDLSEVAAGYAYKDKSAEYVPAPAAMAPAASGKVKEYSDVKNRARSSDYGYTGYAKSLASYEKTEAEAVKMLGAVAGNDHNSSDILIEDSYINFAWGFKYTGIVICRDGSIYSFDYSLGRSKNKFDKSILESSPLEKNKYILENSELEDERVSAEDMKKIAKYISKIDADKKSKEKDVMADAGERSVTIYDYAHDREVLLKQTGNRESENTSAYAARLVNLIEKYTNSARVRIAKNREHTLEQWAKRVFADYAQMPVYADLSGLGLGVFKQYKDQNEKPCIIQINNDNGSVTRVYSVDFKGFDSRERFNTESFNIYTVNDLLIIMDERQAMDAQQKEYGRLYALRKDDVKAGKYDAYVLSWSGNEVRAKIQSFPKRQITMDEFKEEIQNGTFLK